MVPDESQVEVSGQTEDIFGYVTYASGFWPRTLHVRWITTLELPLRVTIPRFMTQKKWAQCLAKNILATQQNGIKCNFEMTLHRKASWFNETTTLPTYIHQSVSIGPMHHNRTKDISSPLLSTHYMLSMDTLGKTAETSKTPLQLLAPQHALERDGTLTGSHEALAAQGALLRTTLHDRRASVTKGLNAPSVGRTLVAEERW